MEIELSPGFYDDFIIDERSDVGHTITIEDEEGRTKYFTGYSDMQDVPIFSYHKRHSVVYGSKEEVSLAIYFYGFREITNVSNTPIHFIN